MNDCLGNSDLYRSYPSLYVVNGRPPEVTKVSDTAVRFKFAAPYGLFLQQLATPLGQHATLFPRHYARQFMPRRRPDVLAKARAAGFSDWPSFFRCPHGRHRDPQPLEQPAEADARPLGDHGALHRRCDPRRDAPQPYFWQVDTQGNQLPYIDWHHLRHRAGRRIAHARRDRRPPRYQERHLDSLQNKPTLARSAQRGGYRVFDTTSANSQQMTIYLNIVHKDPRCGPCSGTRISGSPSSHAIDRAEIIEAVYLGQGEALADRPAPDAPVVPREAVAPVHQLDRAKSNQMLDALGYNRRDSEHFRLRPDGQRVAFTINVIPTLNPDHVDALELVKRHWATVGVDMRVGSIERACSTRAWTRTTMTRWSGSAREGWTPCSTPATTSRCIPQGSLQAIPWAQWYASNGREGQEPERQSAPAHALYDEAKTKVSVADQGVLMKQVFDLAADAFETFGITLAPNLFGIAVNRLKNVPNGMPQAWSWPNPGPSMPQQYFFEG
jgi:peptide/nickel transport system substrate-binding protein